MLEHPTEASSSSEDSLSVASHFVRVLRLPRFDPQDSAALHEIREAIESRADLGGLHHVASGWIMLQDYEDRQVPEEIIPGFFSQLPTKADIILSTPPLALSKDFAAHKATAVGLAVDEAGGMASSD